jgi:hypothetical protein
MAASTHRDAATRRAAGIVQVAADAPAKSGMPGASMPNLRAMRDTHGDFH